MFLARLKLDRFSAVLPTSGWYTATNVLDKFEQFSYQHHQNDNFRFPTSRKVGVLGKYRIA
jgi:hypothetical protein